MAALGPRAGGRRVGGSVRDTSLGRSGGLADRVQACAGDDATDYDAADYDAADYDAAAADSHANPGRDADSGANPDRRRGKPDADAYAGSDSAFRPHT